MNLIKITFTILMILLVTLCEIKAQQQKRCDIKTYNYYTNLAELKIVDSSYQEALNYFDSAFFYGNTPFYRDRYNYVVCNALAGNYEKTRSEIIYLLEKGKDRNVLLNNPAFSSFLLSYYGADIYKLEVKPTYDTNLKFKYDSLVFADQYFRKLKHHHYREFYSDTIDKIDSSNVEFMKVLIRDHGWPTIDNIGIPEGNYFPYQLIIMHQGYGEYQYYNFAEDIIFAYENCLIEPDKASYLISWSNDNDFHPACLFTAIYDSLDTFERDSLASFTHKTGFLLSPDEISKLEKERKSFFQESFADLKRKVIYSLKDKRFNFEYLGGMEFMTYRYLKDYNYACSNLTPIE